MQRLAFLLLVATIAVAVPALAQAGAINLKIVYRASDTSKPRLLELHCTPPIHGTLPAPASTCRKLAALGDDALARPGVGTTACSQIYGGPQTALVTGIYFGRRVWARLTRVDGCAIARWNALAFLLPKPSS
jgi:hypothetical protein